MIHIKSPAGQHGYGAGMPANAQQKHAALICDQCGDEVLLGEPMHWTVDRPGIVWHEACAQRCGLVAPADQHGGAKRTGGPRRKPTIVKR